jgi:hypothetical protein
MDSGVTAAGAPSGMSGALTRMAAIASQMATLTGSAAAAGLGCDLVQSFRRIEEQLRRR